VELLADIASMQLIDAQTAESYLRDTGQLAESENVRIEALSGGVSNCVLYVHRDESHGPDFVLKQAREQLQVEAAWFCSPERGLQEVSVLEVCQDLLGDSVEHSSSAGLAIHVPEILFQDKSNFAYAMTAAPRDHVVWKSELLQFQCEPAIAACCGDLLSLLHAKSWQHAEVRDRLANRQFFMDLRIDPYYRYLVRSHKDLESNIELLVASLAENACTLVHGDYSPKNLLVHKQGCMLVDFEVGHFGDPAFDVGFFLSHLVLKAIWSGDRCESYWELIRVFWEAYWVGMERIAPQMDRVDLERRAILNCAACLLARVDGKSPVEYLTSEVHREHVRKVARRLLLEAPGTWSDVVSLIQVYR
jgi:5-methylthioribose kinase